jgi:inosine-uridine nucleoside N-ribohydrolase
MKRLCIHFLVLFLSSQLVAVATERRLVIIDEDGSGPGGSNQMAMMALLQAADVQVLGITIVTGNAWRDDEVQHTLRMLELIGRADVPVFPGAVFPLVRSLPETLLALKLYGKVAWLGAWGEKALEGGKLVLDPYAVPTLPEGAPTTRPQEEDAAHFLIRMVHQHPHQITIYAAGPLTNLAIAQRLDPKFAELAKELIFMGGSLNPITEDPEFTTSPRHEFNFWFDPEAAHVVLRAHWPRIVCTTDDVSIKTSITQQMVDEIATSSSPAAKYIQRFSHERYYMWDEIAAVAWLAPQIITKERLVYMDVNLDRGAGYGDTLIWTDKVKPDQDVQLVHAQADLDLAQFNRKFIDLMKAPSPGKGE